MSDFRHVLEAAGLFPRDIVPDGRWRRCKTADKRKRMNGAYCLSVDGRRGWWRNWATDLDINEWRDETTTYTAERRVIDEQKVKQQRDRDRQVRIQRMHEARGYWADCGRYRHHPYLENKGLSAQGCTGLRIYGDLLVVPVFWRQSLISLQRIDAAGNKRFWSGAPVKGGSFILERDRAALTCVVEGLATGLAVYQSVRNARVIVAFDCGNLLSAVDVIKPTGAVVIAADNDHATKARRGINPGLEHAQNVADYLGCGVAYPKGIAGSDWADFLKEEGEGAARRIEREVTAAARYVAPRTQEAPHATG